MKTFTIIWDFDGTLLPNDPYDSEQSLLMYKLYETEEKVPLLLHALTRLLIYADNRERLRKTFKRYYTWFLNGTSITELDRVSERLATKIPEADRQAIIRLKTQGHIMMVFSCGTVDLSERVLKFAGLSDCFSLIEGNRFQFAEDRIVGMQLQLPDPDDKLKRVKLLKLSPERTIIVGDGYTDLPLLNWSSIPVMIDRTGKKKKRFTSHNFYFITSIPEIMNVVGDAEN